MWTLREEQIRRTEAGGWEFWDGLRFTHSYNGDEAKKSEEN